MANDAASELNQRQPYISTVCELGYHKLCSGVDAECACLCHAYDAWCDEDTEKALDVIDRDFR